MNQNEILFFETFQYIAKTYPIASKYKSDFKTSKKSQTVEN